MKKKIVFKNSGVIIKTVTVTKKELKELTDEMIWELLGWEEQDGIIASLTYEIK